MPRYRPEALTAQAVLATKITEDTALRSRHIAVYPSIPPRVPATKLPSSTMTSVTYLGEPHTETTCGPRHAIFNTVRGRQHLIWIICASISLLSARHLLVEQNIHYPLQLYFNQLVVAGLITLWPYRRWQDTWELFREGSQSRRPITWGTILLAASMSFMSLSIICTLQAILHFQNLPTFFMMTVRFHISQILVLRH